MPTATSSITESVTAETRFGETSIDVPTNQWKLDGVEALLSS